MSYFRDVLLDYCPDYPIGQDSIPGTAGSYFTPQTRPLLYSYYERLETRKSVQQVLALVSSAPRMTILHQIKKASPYVLGVMVAGVAAAVAYTSRLKGK